MEIKISIKPDGEVQVTVKGVQGVQCLNLTKILEQSLGDVISREKTPEYYGQVQQVIVEQEKLSES